MGLDARVIGRRWVLRQTGRGVIGFAVVGLAACSSTDGGPASSGTPRPTSTGTQPPATKDTLAWSRVDLGFVSAYVLVRGQQAAVIDTGVSGSTDAIGRVLTEAGAGWDRVRHVILTHKHPDHAGSISEVLAQASGATGYVGQADLSSVTSAQPLRPVADGDEVFGLQLIGTPGHTPGHLAAFDPATGLLLAGDALNNDGELSGANPSFSEDIAAAAESVRRLAALKPRTILVGHGSPVTEGAAAALEALATA